MKFLILSSEFPPGPGGIGTHAYQIARHLSKWDCKVKVITPQDFANEAEKTIFNQNIPFEILPIQGNVKFSIQKGITRFTLLHHEIKTWKPDALIASGQRSLWMAAMATLLSKTAVIAIGHGSEFTTGSRFTQWALSKMRGVICVSSYTRTLIHEFPHLPKLVTVIPNGAAEDCFYPIEINLIQEFKQKFYLGDGPLLLSVGSVTPRKGHDLVIRAMPQVLEIFPKTNYIICGIPRYVEAWMELARQLNVAEHVHFFGNVDEKILRSAYNASDLLLMTSRQAIDGDVEGFGIAVIEAALCSKAAIVSGQSGLEEAVEKDITGLVVPPENPQAIATAILDMLTQTEKLKRMGVAAQKRALASYTWEKISRRYLDVIKTMLETP